MEAKELRIGNKVSLYGNIATVCRDDYHMGLAITKGKPIPLSYWWLEKFGFDNLGEFGFGIGKFRLEYSARIPARIDSEFVFWMGHKIVKIYHVHQLQNLFFALTGNELELI